MLEQLSNANSEVFKCRNCGSENRGEACSNCGQERIPPDDLSVGGLWRHIIGYIIDFDSKILRSLWFLVNKPGKNTLDFVEGRRAKIAHPIALFLLIAALYGFFAPPFHPMLVFPTIAVHTMTALGFPPAMEETARKAGVTLESRRASRERSDRLQAIKGLAVAASVISGLCLSILFFSKKRRVGEHLAMGLELSSFNLVAIGLVAWFLSTLPGYWMATPMILLLMTDLVYYLIATRRVYAQSWARLVIKWLFLAVAMQLFYVLAGAGLLMYGLFFVGK